MRKLVNLLIVISFTLALLPATALGGTYASDVVDYEQGLRKNGTAVLPVRSIPEQGLIYESGQNASNFFSLGFGGWIIVDFECRIINGAGTDVKLIEDTWGSYPEENAKVYASQNGTDWTYLGEADNLTRDALGIHSIQEFDLLGLMWARYIKVEDSTDPAIHGSTADGYDLNAVEALQECIEELIVPVDIKPTSCPNPLNTNQRGVLPVAVLGTDSFDVNEIDPATVLLEGVAPIRWSLEDVATPYEPYEGKVDCLDCTTEGPDGYLDLTLKFEAQEVVAALGVVNDGDCVVLHLTGQLLDGTSFSGEDVVKIIKK